MKHLYVLFFFGFTLLAQGQVTYADDVAELIYQKCSTCHRPGEIGPMSLTNYDEVRSWGATIKFVTSNKIMPPWQPDPEFSHFLEENFLTDAEIAEIAEWVDNGMARGEVANEPAFPDFPEGSVLGTPDLVLTMEEPWLHEGNGRDDYRYFVFPTNFTEDKIIKSVEFRPDNKKIVHHALVFEDTTGEAAQKDAATPEYGFNGFGSFISNDPTAILTQKQYPGFVPGQKPILSPDGTGQVLTAGADIVVQVHYAPWSVDEFDQSSLNIFFKDDSEVLEREIESHIMVPLQSVIGEQFFILDNQEKTFHGEYRVPIDVSLMTIAPHMHLLGKSWEVWMEKPDGERVDLISVPEWDFNWQGSYYFDRYIVAPAGSIIHAVASYDNTTNNPENPNNPPRFVTWGDGTADEMYYLPIGFVRYQPGDEDIVFEGTTSTEEIEKDQSFLYPISPNPVNDLTVAGFRLAHGQSVNISILDIEGKLVRELREGEFFNTGEHFINFSTVQLSSGLYFLRVAGKDFELTQKFVKG